MDDEEIRLPDPAKGDAGWGVALGMVAPVLSAFDQDYAKDAHFGQHQVASQAAITPTAAHPPAPAGTGTPAVQAQAAPAIATQATAAPHHDLAAPGSRPRERSVEGTDPTDMVAHLDDQDLEDLATLLFDRLQTRLRRDLIVDRERTGFLTDFR